MYAPTAAPKVKQLGAHAKLWHYINRGLTLPTNDADIRSALHNKILKKFHMQKNARVIDELGVAHGTHRIDVAVVNGQLQGFEIKSAKDNLNRLTGQISTFSKCFEKLTVAVAEVHLKSAIECTPHWVGILLATEGSRGAVHFEVKRKPLINPKLDTLTTAHFLWKSEAIELLEKSGIRHRNLPRAKLYKLLEENLTQPQILNAVKHYLICRKNWRLDHAPTPSGAPLQPASK